MKLKLIDTTMEANLIFGFSGRLSIKKRQGYLRVSVPNRMEKNERKIHEKLKFFFSFFNSRS